MWEKAKKTVTPAFGASTSAFGAPASASAGAGASTPAFGKAAPAFGKAAPAFGAGAAPESAGDEEAPSKAALPEDAPQVANGEEGEEVVLQVRAKLFRWQKMRRQVGQKTDSMSLVANSAVATAAAAKEKESKGAAAKDGAEGAAAEEAGDAKDAGAGEGGGGEEGGGEAAAAPEEAEKGAEKEEKPEGAEEEASTWAEAGIGPLRVLYCADKKRARLVMRRESERGGQGTKVILNALLGSYTKCSVLAEKNIKVSCVDSDQKAPATYLIRVAAAEKARELLGAIESHCS